jgi:hypothetical protein
MAYAISLSISCVCLHANDNILKGRASAAYERAMSDLEAMPDATWHSVLQHVLVQHVTLLTNPEGPAQSAPRLTRKQIIERDTARKEASTAAAASAAAAAADSGGDGDGSCGGDAAGDDAASVHGDENEPAQPAAAKAACRCRRRRRPAAPRA